MKKKYNQSVILFIVIIVTNMLYCKNTKSAKQIQDGDIIFQETVTMMSTAIKFATASRYTHVGIILKYNDGFKVLEAVQPVRLTPLRRFIERGVDKHYVIKRLKESRSIVTKQSMQRIKNSLTKYIGKNYDLWLRWDDRRLYCSELVWKIYSRFLNVKIGKLKKLGEFNLNHPSIRYLIQKRYKGKAPLREPVISPVAIFNSPKLETVLIKK